MRAGIRDLRPQAISHDLIVEHPPFTVPQLGRFHLAMQLTPSAHKRRGGPTYSDATSAPRQIGRWPTYY